MKKLLCLALALCLMLTLFACGGKTDTPSGDDKTSTPTNSEPSGETEELADIADFEGTWKLGSPLVACYTVNATDKTVTAYAANGIEIGTFPVVATTEGIVLKMGGFGIVPLNDPTALTITTVPTVSSYDLVGEYEMIYGEYLGATLSIVDNKNWTLAGESYAKGPDQGPYDILNGEAQLSPTKELGGTVYHKILGGGKVLKAYQPSNRVYIEKTYAEKSEGKTLKNYFDLLSNKWVDSADSNFTLEFTDKGRVIIAGEDMGIWYPTATGATAEFIDGSTQYVEYTDEGIEFYYKDFVRVQ